MHHCTSNFSPRSFLHPLSWVQGSRLPSGLTVRLPWALGEQIPQRQVLVIPRVARLSQAAFARVRAVPPMTQRASAWRGAQPGSTSAPGRGSPHLCSGLTSVVSTAIWASRHKGRPLATTSMRRPSVAGTSTLRSRRATLAATRANARRCPLEWARTMCEEPDLRTSCAVIREGIKGPAAATTPGREGEWQSQASEQHDAVLRIWHDEVGTGGEHGEGAAGAIPPLRQQQRTRRRIKVTEKRLERALVLSATAVSAQDAQ